MKNNRFIPKEYATAIANIEKQIRGFFKKLLVRDYKELQRKKAIANFTEYGEMFGYTIGEELGLLCIHFENIVDKKDATREINKVMEEFIYQLNCELIIEKNEKRFA